jgi:SAM-dependent methyltransferase
MATLERDAFARNSGFNSFTELLDNSDPLPMLPGDTVRSYVARKPSGRWFLWEDDPEAEPPEAWPQARPIHPAASADSQAIPRPKYLAHREITVRLQSPVQLTTWVIDRVIDPLLDRQFGIDSSRRHGLDEFGINNSEFVDYQPMSYLDLKALFKNIPTQGVFVDYGCGKGRAVCVAATRPFRAVFGVEISPELSRVAKRNVDRVMARLRATVTIVTADATTFPVPADATVFLFNNPFRGGVFGKVLENIRQSTQKNPREVLLVCSGSPADEGLLEPFRDSDWLSPAFEFKLPTGCRGSVYRSKSQANTPG